MLLASKFAGNIYPSKYPGMELHGPGGYAAF